MRFFLTIGLMSLFASPGFADWPRGASPLNQLGRFFGTGWSDGYHACRVESRAFGADLPPTPQWLQHRRAQPHASQSIVGPPRVAAPAEAEEHDLDWRSQDVQQPVSPPNPPVPPSILEEIRRYEHDAEQVEPTATLEEQAEYEEFLKMVRRQSTRSTRLSDPRFIHEPTDRQTDQY